MLTWELLGAVVGAGLASGREIASFFSQYGNWSFAGIVLAVAALIWLGGTSIPRRWQGRWPGRIWQLLLWLLLAATGGAMLSGAGEVAGLVLSLEGAYWMGLVVTLVVAWALAHRTAKGLAWVSRLLLGVMAVLIAAGFLLPPMQAVNLTAVHVPLALVRGIAYGGFNAALEIPLMSKAPCSPEEKRRSMFYAGMVVLLLLLLGNLVLLRHPALIGETMPFIRMLSGLGQAGYYLGAICLYLAVLSTLTACLRGLGRGWLSVLTVGIISLFGFSGVVEMVYPLLGGGCCLMLVTAKFTNWVSKAFHSRRDMV